MLSTRAWLATAPVLQALVAEHFVYDHSAVPAILLDDGVVGRDWRLPEVLPSVWPDTTIRTQPYTITTSNGHIIEIPDNGALADWATVEVMGLVLDRAIKAWEQHPQSTQLVSIGFHQEGAAAFINRIESLVHQCGIMAERGIPLRFVTSHGAAVDVAPHSP